MYFLSLVFTFHVTIEMYRQPYGADDIGTAVLEPRCTLSTHSFSTARTVIHYRSGGWRVDGKRQVIF